MIAHMLGDRSRVAHGTLVFVSIFGALTFPASSMPRMCSSSALFTSPAPPASCGRPGTTTPTRRCRLHRNVEHPSPAKRGDDQDHQGRRDRRSEPPGAVGDALAETALVARIPELHGAGCSGKRAALADAEQETNEHE